MIDATQAWFWTPTWQAGERAAHAERDTGSVENFDSGTALLDGLTSLTKRISPPRKR